MAIVSKYNVQHLTNNIKLSNAHHMFEQVSECVLQFGDILPATTTPSKSLTI